MGLSEQIDKIFTIKDRGFDSMAKEVFHFQYEHNPVYKRFTEALGFDISRIKGTETIPFLPINFFKTHSIRTTVFEPEIVFESSGTTGTVNSHHFVKDLSIYKNSFSKCFEIFYGPVEEYCILGLLPSYLERNNSSLVYMVNQLIGSSRHPDSGFYLGEYDQLFSTIQKLEQQKQKTLLIGVTFALLDFAERIINSEKNMSLTNTFIMETGGMKGRRKEMIREEVHGELKKAFGIPAIHSEYGMTELLSQAYSNKDGIFHCPSWMKVLVRDEDDPSQISKQGTGLINIIDLANIYSCSFIATDDIGRVYDDGSFEILGRKDNSDLRGCSLLIA